MSLEKILRKPMFLLGNLTNDVGGNKLPTKKQALNLLFYYTKNMRTTVYEGCKITIEKFRYASKSTKGGRFSN